MALYSVGMEDMQMKALMADHSIATAEINGRLHVLDVYSLGRGGSLAIWQDAAGWTRRHAMGWLGY